MGVRIERAHSRVAQTLYRAMLPELTDGLPEVGTGANMLGVRPGVDLRSGLAGPGRGGLSVTVDLPQKMNVAVRPKAFGGLHGETIMYELHCAILVDYPSLRLGPVHPRKSHAEIEAAADCEIHVFQASLATTRPRWTRSPLPTLCLGS